jgi:DNA-binding CsgD family transcriptional regulator
MPDLSFVGIARMRIPLWLSLTMLFSWTANTLFPSDKAGVFTIGDSGFVLPHWALSLLFFVFAFFTTGLVARNFAFNFRSRRILVLAALLMAGGLAVGELAEVFIPLLSAPVNMLALALLGATTPLLYIETIRQFMKLGFKVMLVCTAIATVLSDIICYVLVLIPTPYSTLIIVAFPLVLMACLVVSLGHAKEEHFVATEIESPALVPWKLLVTSLFQGLAFGLLFLYLHISIDPAGTRQLLHLLVMFSGFSCAAFSLLLFAMVFNFDFNLLMYKIGFSLLAFGVFFATFEPSVLLGAFLGAVGYRFIDLLIFTLVVYLAGAKGVSLNWLVAWPTCMLYIGLFISYAMIKTMDQLSASVSSVMLLAFIALVVLFLAVVLTSERNIAGAWGFVKLTDREASAHPHRSQVVHNLEQRFELSSRQGEVFRLLVAGRMRKEIAHELHISEQTVKVHTRAIYQKLSVHSYKELLLLISHEETHLL